MAREEGIVIGVGDHTVTVKTTRSASCEGCASQGSCTAQGDDMEVQVLNGAGARLGDRVVIEFKTASLLKATFLLYVFPVICLLAGALAGNIAGERLGINPSGLSAVLAFLLFFASFALVKFGSNRMAEKDDYRPKIVRVSRSAASVSGAPSSVPS